MICSCFNLTSLCHNAIGVLRKQREALLLMFETVEWNNNHPVRLKILVHLFFASACSTQIELSHINFLISERIGSVTLLTFGFFNDSFNTIAHKETLLVYHQL